MLWRAWPPSIGLNLGWGLGLVLGLAALPCAAADSAEMQKAAPRPKLQTTPAGSGLCRPTGWRAPAEGLQLRPFGPAPAGETRFEADRLEGSLDGQVRLSGSVQVQLDDLAVRADRLTYDSHQSRLQASGGVQMLRAEDRFSGSELRYDSQTSTGYLLQPRFYLSATDAGGRAERIDLLGAQQMDIRGLRYSSCKVGDDETPPWQLTASRLQVDIAANEGIAEDAVLRFYDVPILALPKLSFPVTEERKSGWLPPSIDLSTTGGLVVAAPYYWNIAPQHDATLTPVLSLKRGAGMDGEFRYLQPTWRGETQLSWLPRDEVTTTSRWASRGIHQGDAPLDSDYRIDWLRVSDEDYWTDGLRGADNLTPRLLGSSATLRRLRREHWDGLGWLDQHLYAATQDWQVLNGSSSSGDLITAPYRREVQLGAQWGQQRETLDWSVQTELNRFVPGDGGTSSGQLTGQRAHVLGQLAWQLGRGGWRLTPRLGINAAAYDLQQPMADGRRRASRVVPTFSLDSGWTFERELKLFERSLTQTLEPRVLYVRTPWRDQSQLPNFDSDVLDFNPTTIFGDSSFSGVDRVADAQRITAGLTTRFVESGSGIEWARLGFAQRYLLQDQLITADGQPLTQRMSDALLFGSTQAIPHWTLNGSLRYDPAISRVARSSTSVTYSPGPWRTLHLTHSLQRGGSEQFGLGWQWPIGSTTSAASLLAAQWNGPRERSDNSAGSDCSGRLYTVGRIDYSKFDRRITGALAGFEYDAGCWVGRVVAERKSTGASAATTRLMLQLEFVGLSRLALGSNPLTRLKDNIPGYRLLRERSGNSSDPAEASAP